MGEPPAVQGVRCCAGVVWCLREGERDGRAEEFEGAALGGGGCGEDVEVAVGEDGGVAGEGGEVVEQAAEAADGVVVGVGFGAGFGGGGVGSFRGGDGVVAVGWLLVGVGQRCPGQAQVRDHV